MTTIKNNRLELIYHELLSRCRELNCFEFEYYWEMWDFMWQPWFIDIHGKSQSFSFDDLTQADLDELVEEGRIDIIKVYSKDEMPVEFDRKRYRIKK